MSSRVLLWGLPVLALFVLCFGVSEISMAGTSGVDASLGYEVTLENIMKSITGPVAKLIAIVAFAGGVISWIFVPDMGRLTQTLASLSIGIGLVVFAVDIVDAISGDGAMIGGVGVSLGFSLLWFGVKGLAASLWLSTYVRLSNKNKFLPAHSMSVKK